MLPPLNLPLGKRERRVKVKVLVLSSYTAVTYRLEAWFGEFGHDRYLVRLDGRIYPERVNEDGDEPPDGDHEEHPDDAPDDILTRLGPLFFVGGLRDIGEDAPDDDEDREARLKTPPRSYVPSDDDAPVPFACSSRVPLEELFELSLPRESSVP